MNDEQLIAWFTKTSRLFGIHGSEETVDTLDASINGFLLIPINISGDCGGLQNVKISRHTLKNRRSALGKRGEQNHKKRAGKI